MDTETLVREPLRRPPVVAPRRVPGLVLVVLVLLAASSVVGLVPAVPFLVAALVLGIGVRAAGLVGDAHAAGLSFAAKTILRAGIVLLGLRLSVADVVALGPRTLAIIVTTVAVTFGGTLLMGRWLGLSTRLAILVASGFSICGNSAIASVDQAAGADEDELAAAIGLVAISGTAAVVLLPVVGPWLDLTDVQLGLWAGASVQDTAQVIAASAAVGPVALAVATAVKLTRVLLLAPIVAGVSLWARSSAAFAAGEADPAQIRPPLLPLFVVGFVGAMALRSINVIPEAWTATAASAEQYALAAGMVGLGASVRLDRLAQIGGRAIMLGATAWVLVAGVPLLAMALLGA